MCKLVHEMEMMSGGRNFRIKFANPVKISYHHPFGTPQSGWFIMAIIKLSAELREATGSRASRKLRSDGFFPANLYSHGDPSTPLKLASSAWSKALAEDLKLVTLELPGSENQLAAVREIQRNPLDQEVIHVDLLKIKMDETSEFSVRIDFTGIPVGIKHGGVHSISSNSVEIEVLPSNLPDHIKCDITDLDIGDSISAKDLVLPEGVVLLSDPDMTIVSVMMIRTTVEAPVEAVEGEEGEEGEEEAEEKEKEKGSSKHEKD